MCRMIRTSPPSQTAYFSPLAPIGKTGFLWPGSLTPPARWVSTDELSREELAAIMCQMPGFIVRYPSREGHALRNKDLSMKQKATVKFFNVMATASWSLQTAPATCSLGSRQSSAALRSQKATKVLLVPSEDRKGRPRASSVELVDG
jgi:hypothetical protein